jgi:hypothetical protein
LTKNLISDSTLEDKGYEVTFHKVKVFIKPAGSSEKMNRMIGITEYEQDDWDPRREGVQATVSSRESIGQ